jgi:hypothetical protein
MKTAAPVALLATLFVGVLLQACGVLPRIDAVPPDETERAVIPGIPDSRFWLDRDLSAPFIQSVIQDLKREQEALARSGMLSNPLPPVYLLGISGGGDDGAFAAGVKGYLWHKVLPSEPSADGD